MVELLKEKMSLKSERALRKGNLTRTRRRAFVLVDTAGSKRELCSVLKDLDVALQALLEVNEKHGRRHHYGHYGQCP